MKNQNISAKTKVKEQRVKKKIEKYRNGEKELADGLISQVELTGNSH